MAIFRGVGGSGDSSDNSYLQEVTAQANAAEASATSAANSLAAIQDTEVTSASFDTSDGVLTLTKTGGATVTADLDGRFLTSYTETDPVFSAHASSGITATQISNWDTAYDWGNHASAGYLTAHQDISGKADTSGDTFTGDILFNDGVKAKFGTDSDLAIYHVDGGNSIIEETGEGALVLRTNGSAFAVVSDENEYMINATVDGGVVLYHDNETRLTTSSNTVAVTSSAITDVDFSVDTDTLYVDSSEDKVGINTSTPSEALDVNGNISVTGTVNGRDVATDGSKLDDIEANADVTDTANVTSAGAAMLASSPTFTGTITAPNVDITHTGTVTTNIATGTGGLGDTKTLNLGTGYGGSLVGLTTVNIGTQSTACQNTVNIGSGVSVTNREDIINLKGNVTVDGTLNGATYEKVKRTRFLKRGYISTSIINTLTTSLSRIGDLLQTKSSDGSENELEFSMGLQYANTYGTNDGVFYVTVTAPTPSDEDTVNLGTVTSATTSGSLYTIALSGDVTKHLSPYCGMSVNSDGSSAFGFNNNQSWYYYSSNNTTYITMYAYQANKPLQGDTVYLHPFDWELAGTEILGTEYQFDKVVYNASLMFREYQNVYLGYFKSNLSVQVKAKEVTQPQGEDGTTILVRSIEGKITQTES